MFTLEGTANADFIANEVLEGETMLVTYVPGNGTQYHLVLSRLLDIVADWAGFPTNGTHILVSWIGHGAWAFDLDDPPHWTYVAEKLACGQGDALAIGNLLSKMAEARAAV